MMNMVEPRMAVRMVACTMASVSESTDAVASSMSTTRALRSKALGNEGAEGGRGGG